MRPSRRPECAKLDDARRRHVRLSLVLIAVIVFGMAFSCNDPSASRDGESTLDRVRREGAIRIGFANEAPYAFLDPKTGELTGEAPEILRVVTNEMGVSKVEGVLTEFGSLIPGLRAKRFDIIAAGMYITPQRCQQIAFSNPTYGVGEGFIVVSGNPKGLHGYEDVARKDSAKLGVVAGTVERGYAQSCGIPDERITIFPDTPSALAGVRAGHVDAYAGTKLTLMRLLSKSSDGAVEMARPFSDPVIHGRKVRGYGAFGLRKEDTALLAELNDRLADFIGTDAHRKLVEPLGFTIEEDPEDVTAAELCGQ